MSRSACNMVGGEVMATIRGGAAADRVLLDITGGCAQPDALFAALQAEFLMGDQSRTRAFVRQVQKAVEQRAAGTPQ